MRTYRYPGAVLILMILLASCSTARKTTVRSNSTDAPVIKSTVKIKKDVPEVVINTRDLDPGEVVSFAKKLIGVKYKYGSADKAKGFDCSGFITYVFSHFRVPVPRTSAAFTNAGMEVPVAQSKPGDLILFTGSDAGSGVVGHMGIITSNNKGNVEFIHASTSRGVMISGMNSYFIPRFVKVNRIFK